MDEIKQEKILFIHMNQLGDLLFSLPLLSAARKQWKDKKLYSLVRPHFVSLLRETGFVDEIIKRPYSDLASTLDVLAVFRKEDFSKAVLFSESPETHLMSFVSAIPERYGFESASFGFLLTHKVPREGVPSIKNNRLLGETLGLKDIPADYTGLLTIPVTESAKAREWMSIQEIRNDELVIIAPGASLRRREKHWPVENWVETIKHLQKKKLKPVLIGAISELVDLKKIIDGLETQPLIFTPYNDILPSAALLNEARFFVGIDSGAMHLAAALKIPAVALFGQTDPLQVGPQPLSEHIIVQKPLMDYVRTDEVNRAIDAMIKKTLK